MVLYLIINENINENRICVFVSVLFSVVVSIVI